MEFNFNFEGFEKSGKSKREAIDYLKGLNSSVDFEKLESDFKGDDEAIYDTLKSANFTFSKESEAEKAKRLKEAYTKKQEKTTFWDFNQKAKESEAEKLERKKALYEDYVKDYGLLDQLADATLETTGLNYALDLGQAALNKIGLGNKDYISTSEREKIEKDLTQKAREKIYNGAGLEDLSAGEKFALKRTQEYFSDSHALKSEKEKARLIKKDEDYTKDELDFMERDLGFFHTLFNDERESIKEFKDKYKSENIIASDIQKAINRVKQFSEGELIWNAFSNDKEKKEKFQQEILSDAFKIAELNGFDDVGLDKENQLYFIKKDEQGNEQKYAVNTGFLDNFWDTLSNAKFEIAGGIGASIAAAKKAKGSPLARAGQVIAAGAAGSYAGAFSDALLNDIYLNRESNFQRNLDYALQAGLLSAAGDGVVMSAPFVYKKAIKPAYEKGKEFIGNTALGLVRTVPSANIQAAEKIINEAYTQDLKNEIKQAKEAFGGGVKGDDLHNNFLAKIRKNYETKYGKDDKRTKRMQDIENIFTHNNIKDKQQEILELVRSDKDGQTLAYLLEVAKDDAKIQNNLKQMLNFSTQGVEQSLKNLNINPRDIKGILDEFEAGNKQAFKEVENQISKIYDDKIKVVLDSGEFENFKDELLQNGVSREESLGFLQDLEHNVFNKEGVTFTQLNNFRKNLNYYIFNKDKSPNFVNTVKKIAENKLKGEIDKGIENIFNELPKTAEEVRKLYSQSLKDYATMKELNESLKRLKLQDKALEADKVVDNLIKYAKGQGEAGENNLQGLKNYLGEENNAFLEMQILNRLFKEAIVENEKAKMRVFDSGEFIKRVKELAGDTKGEIQPFFKSKEARDFLELVEGFDKLYKNDAGIARTLNFATAEKLGTALATSAEGAIKQKIVKGAFDPIFRLLPDGIFFGLFSKQIQGAALRYHLKKALLRSLNYDDFKIKLSNQLKKGNFNSKTKLLIDDFMQNLDSFNLEKEQKLKELEKKRLSEANAQKNDEILEAEIIENEVPQSQPLLLKNHIAGLLEYIQKTTPTLLLEDKRFLSTKDLLAYLEKSNIQGKERAFLMRNLERDLEKLRAQIEAGKGEEKPRKAVKKTFEISQEEAQELQNYFNFKGKKPLLRELRENEIKHALKSHGDRESEKARGNIAITKADIEENYPKITSEYDEKFFTLKGVIYVKQVNGHHIVIEEALSGQDKLIFKTMWKTKGDYNREVLAKNAKTSPYPQNADEAVRTESITSQELEQGNPLQSHLSNDEILPQKSLNPRENLENEDFKWAALDEGKMGFLKENLAELNFNNFTRKLKDIKSALNEAEASVREFDGNYQKGVESETLLKDLDKKIFDFTTTPFEAFATNPAQKDAVKEMLSQVKEALNDKFRDLRKIKDDLSDKFDKQSKKAIDENVETLLQQGLKDEILELPFKDDEMIKIRLSWALKEFAFNFKNVKNNPKPLEKKQIKYFKEALKMRGIAIKEQEDATLRYEMAKSKGDKTRQKPTQTKDAKDKTIAKVDAYAKSIEFKALSEDKQRAILSLKDIKPSPMPNKINNTDLQNVLKHFNSKQDAEQRKFYSQLFDETKNNADLILEVEKGKNLRKEYIKAFEHKDTHDLYYIAITQDNDGVNITGFATTQIRKVINDIARSKKVSGSFLGDTQNRQADIIQGPKLASETIPQQTISNDEIDAFLEKGGDYLTNSNYPRETARLILEQNANGKITLSGFKIKGKDYDPQIEAMVFKTKKAEKEFERLMKSYGVNSGDFIDFLPAYKYKLKDKALHNYINKHKGDDNAKLAIAYTLSEDLMRRSGGGRLDVIMANILRQIHIIENHAQKINELKFTDKNGKEHTVSKEAQEAWLETFNLSSIDEAFTPKFSPEVKEALEPILQGDEIKLTKGSFMKLLERDRMEFLPYIKDTLENADAVVRDKENALIFVKDMGKKSYLTSVAKNANDEWVISTNSLKTINTLKNRVDDSGEVLYLSKEAPNILAETFTKRAFSNELASETIPQNELEKLKELRNEKQETLDEMAEIYARLETEHYYDNKEALKFMYKNDDEALESIKNEAEGLKRGEGLTNVRMDIFRNLSYSRLYEKLKDLDEEIEYLKVPFQIRKKYTNISKKILADAFLISQKKAQGDEIDEALDKTLRNYAKTKAEDLRDKVVFFSYEAGKASIINDERLIKQLSKGKRNKIKWAKSYLNDSREEIEALAQSKPLKEFGTNYAEFYRDGKGAVEKLIAEEKAFNESGQKGEFKGQVAGAFYREELGDIDLVWGDENFGLRHILEQRTRQWGEEKALKFAREDLENIVNNGKIYKDENEKIELITEKEILVLGKQDDNKFIITAFRDRRSEKRYKEMENAQTVDEGHFTDKSESEQLKTDDILLSNQSDTITQNKSKNAKIALKIPTQEAESFLKLIQSLSNKSLSKNDKVQVIKNLTEALSSLENKIPLFIDELIERANKATKPYASFEDRQKYKGFNVADKYRLFEAFKAIKNLDAYDEMEKLIKDIKKDKELDFNVKILRKMQNTEKSLMLGQKVSGGVQKDFEKVLKNYEKDVNLIVSEALKVLKVDKAMKLHSNQHLGAGVVGGTLNGFSEDENGNLTFDPEAFLKGFIYGAGGSVALKKGFQILDKNPKFKEALKAEIKNELRKGAESLAKKYPIFANLSLPKYIIANDKALDARARVAMKGLEKEQKGLYNVAFNGKNATLVKQDLERIDNEIALLKGNRYKGAKHERIKHLTDTSKEGYVSDLEFVNLGKSIREYLKEHKEPFVDTNKARIYEWEDKEGVRFRVVVNDIADMDSNPTTATSEIITFYSDRNLNEPMKFKNPALKTLNLDFDLKAIQKDLQEDVSTQIEPYLSKELIKDEYQKNYIQNYNGLKPNKYYMTSNILSVSKKMDKQILQEAINDFIEYGTYLKNNPKGREIRNINYKFFKGNDFKKAKDLLEWHKDSDAITKDEQGLPKVFYHGSDSKHNIFENDADKTNLGFFFSTNKNEAKQYGDKFYKVFLNIKKPFLADEVKITNEKDLQKWAKFLGLDYDKKAYNSFLEMKDYFDDIKKRGESIGLKLSESDGNYANFIDKKGRTINIDLHRVYDATYDIQQAFKDFKHIADRQNDKGFQNKGASHNFLNYARNDFDLILMALDRANAEYGEYEIWTNKNLKELLKNKGYDGIIFNDYQVSVFNSNQIKHIDNKGSWQDESANISKDKPKGKKAEFKYFNEQSPNIYYSNQHLGAGVVGGTLNGFSEDENGNLTFDPEAFLKGFIYGAGGSVGASKAYKLAKQRYYEKNFNRFIDAVNARKSTLKPRFIITPELEKQYRENELIIKDTLTQKLHLRGKVFADYIKLAQKHPEYFANPQEAKVLTQYIAQNPTKAIEASKKGYQLVFAELKGGKGAFALDLEYKGGKHRIRSVYLMKNSQYKKKLYEAKKLGEPILQF